MKMKFCEANVLEATDIQTGFRCLHVNEIV